MSIARLPRRATALMAGAVVAADFPRRRPAPRRSSRPSSAYKYNPRLDAERARPGRRTKRPARANLGYRPVITGNADVGVRMNQPNPGRDETTHPRGPVNLTQPLFTGFQRTPCARPRLCARGREILRDIERRSCSRPSRPTWTWCATRPSCCCRRTTSRSSREQGHAGPLLGRRGDAHRRGAGAGAARRLGLRARSGPREPEDEPCRLRARRRPPAEQPGRSWRAGAPAAQVGRGGDRDRHARERPGHRLALS